MARIVLNGHASAFNVLESDPSRFFRVSGHVSAADWSRQTFLFFQEREREREECSSIKRSYARWFTGPRDQWTLVDSWPFCGEIALGVHLNGLCTWTEEEIHWYVIENVGNHSQPCSSSRLHFPFLRSFFLRFSLFRHSSRGGMGDPSLVLSLGSLERLSSSRFSFFELLPLLSKERERERTGNVFR